MAGDSFRGTAEDARGRAAPPTAAFARQAAARDAVLVLNEAMIASHEHLLVRHRRRLLERVPIVVAVSMTAGGGDVTLYRPGHRPRTAPGVPVRYQLLKSLAHSGLAVTHLVASGLDDPDDRSWCRPLDAYRRAHRQARSRLASLGLPPDEEAVAADVLDRNMVFMDDCLQAGRCTSAGLRRYARACGPDITRLAASAADVQVVHWMGVIEEWRHDLAGDWDEVRATTITSYGPRRNNILFTVLAQFMEPAAVGDRLVLIETTQPAVTCDEALDWLARVVIGRDVSGLFFGHRHLLDSELMAGDAWAVIARECAARSLVPRLPAMAPLRCWDWPWASDPAAGTGPSTLAEVVRELAGA